ncbi:hypothetical protein TYRP_010533 [Tyrophagus putrescentiae]|nr:hypothetical protein TYRP_010533 [Tyrophagus putrescentiae]
MDPSSYDRFTEMVRPLVLFRIPNARRVHQPGTCTVLSIARRLHSHLSSLGLCALHFYALSFLLAKTELNICTLHLRSREANKRNQA